MKTTWSGHAVEVVAVRRDVVAVPVGLEPGALTFRPSGRPH
jgi:hypothetical protein